MSLCAFARCLSGAAVGLAIFVQPLQAAGLCPFLDKVVASVGAAPPFATVRYLDAPGGQCGVADAKGHLSRGILWITSQEWKTKHKWLKQSWACAWNFPALADKDAKVLELRARLKGLDEEFDAADRHEEKTSEERSRFEWDDRSPSAKQARKLDDAAEEEVKRLRRLIRSAKYELGEEMKRVRFEERKKLYAEARKFVSAVSACIFEKKVRGSWHSFADRVKFENKVFKHGIWWIFTKSVSFAKQVGIQVRVPTAGRQMVIEIWGKK